MRIGELADLAGVSSRTIDYYTQIGLIHEAARSPGKHRLYSAESMRVIRVVKELQKQHYSLEEICHLFAGRENGDLFNKIVAVRQHLDILQKELAELYPAIRLCGADEEVRVISRELSNKGRQVLRALMVLLGEPVL